MWTLLILSLLIFSPIEAQDAPLFSLEVLFDGVPVEGGGWVITVTLETETDLKEAKLEIHTPEGLRINSGEEKWQGPLDAGNEIVLELALTLTRAFPQEITVEASATTKNGQHLKKTVRRKTPEVSN